MRERLKYWLFQKGKGCSRCCLRCEYYDICRRDVKNGKPAEKAADVLAVEPARRKNEKGGVLFRVCEYVALKQEERRKREEF